MRSRVLKVAVIAIIVGAFFYLKNLNDQMENHAKESQIELEKNKADKAAEKVKLEAMIKKELAPAKKAKKKPVAKKLQKGKIKRVGFDKYEYEIVHYKAHNPYKKDVGGEYVEPKFKDYGAGYKKHSSLTDELDSELKTITN